MTVALVVQARMGSTRLPGKVMLPLAGQPLLWRMLERLRAVKADVELIVATTTDGADDAIADLCSEHVVHCYRGDPTDLLDRHVRAAESVSADVVVKIPSDCPLIDPACVERVLGFFAATRGQFDFVSNLHPPTWPDGNDVEVMTLDALRVAHREAHLPHEREHTTPFLWDHPERFRIGNVRWETGRDYAASHRLTIDYPEDYELIAAVYEALHEPRRPVFTLADVLALLAIRPDVLSLNERYAGTSWYRHHRGELRTVPAEHMRDVPPR